MTRLILHIFEVLKIHSLLRWTLLVVLTAILGLLLAGQSYKEDISDFLPLDDVRQKAFLDYQNTSSARRIYVIFQATEGSCQTAVDQFCEILDRADTAQTINYMTADDPEVMQEALRTLYAKMPYLLTTEDYAYIDSLTAAPDYITRQLDNDRQLLMLPTAGMLSLQIQHDPLNLFLPVLERVKPATTAHQSMLFVDSPYGASETEHNAQLVAMLQQTCDSVGSLCPDVSIRLTGGPVIAVGNAQQIKSDSMFAVTLAIILILLLLWVVFRNIVNLLLIAFSIGWGWLFAMGFLTLVHNDVSIIIIGISSIILGIAVNYPLHLIAHTRHTPDMKSALKEIVMPLVVGNITTVGAFLALVPLKSVALRDLGLFSAFLLIGTILFVLVWLPHMVHHTSKASPGIFSRIGDVKLENKSWMVWTVAVLTIVLGYFSMQTSFDADLRNINYMTAEQRQDMQFLEQMTSPQSQDTDLKQWNEWRTGKGAVLCKQLKDYSSQAGFADDSFDDFYHLMETTPVATDGSPSGSSLTSAIVNNLSESFNYIGWACGLIVFVFLWFSLGSIELALLSFLPMAVSWIWILGIMSLLGIQFNVVNVILATFIFGQGDDYTIFMTEGCQYEYTYRRKMLVPYKNSIIISALIMFIGIGTLIFAKHPALFALAQVTIIGMFSVVLMAFVFPPLIFRWLVAGKQGYRRRPLTLASLLGLRRSDDPISLVRDIYRYRGIEISTAVNKSLRHRAQNYEDCPLCEKSNTNYTGTVPVTSESRCAVPVILQNSGWGELTLLTALQHPDVSFIAIEPDEERRLVAQYAAEIAAPNLKYVEELKN